MGTKDSAEGVIGAIVATATSQDQTLAAAARELTTRAILEIDDILEHGTPAAKQQILRSFVPALIRAGEAQQTNEEMDQMRSEFRSMMDELRKYEGPGDGKQERDEMVEEAPADLPPPPDPQVPSQS